jgi:ABC-type phosphate transport system permease subunit
VNCPETYACYSVQIQSPLWLQAAVVGGFALLVLTLVVLLIAEYLDGRWPR